MTYVVQPGDSLFTIAQKFNTTVGVILSANPKITNPNLIFPGQSLVIPISAINCPFLRQGNRGPEVKRFQILLRIAGFNPGPIDGIFGRRTQAALTAFQSSIKELEPTGVADEGTWTALGAACGPRPEITLYTVRPGDTLFIISNRFNVSVSSILSVNSNITDPNTLYTGQVINIPRS